MNPPAVASEERRETPCAGRPGRVCKYPGLWVLPSVPLPPRTHMPESLVWLQPVTVASGSTPTPWGSRASPDPRSSSLWQGFLCPTACHEQGVMPEPRAVPQPSGGTGASSTGAQGSQGKALLGWCRPPTPAYWVLRHPRGRVIGWGPRGPGPPSFSMGCCSLAPRGQRALPGFSCQPGIPQPPGPSPPAGLGGP